MTEEEKKTEELKIVRHVFEVFREEGCKYPSLLVVGGLPDRIYVTDTRRTRDGKAGS